MRPSSDGRTETSSLSKSRDHGFQPDGSSSSSRESTQSTRQSNFSILLQVTREQLIPLPEDSYYDFQLIGCQVTTCDGKRLGSVSEIQRYGAAPLLVVVDEEKGERLIPLTRNICLEIDIAGKRILVEPPEGLLDL
jgi:16S rRNA processing protein RimM